MYFLVIIIVLTKTGQKLSTKVPEEIFAQFPCAFVCAHQNGYALGDIFLVAHREISCKIGWAPQNSSLAMSVMADLVAHNNLPNVTVRVFFSLFVELPAVCWC